MMPQAWAEEDHLESYNRGVESVNAGVDRAVLKPVTKGYMAVIPDPVRIAGRNVVNNLQEPVTIVNDVLQGKVTQGVQDTARFIFNSTFGILGLIDIATPMGLQRHEEDFGQTFAVWGWKDSQYINLPLLGPATLRDAIAKPLAWAMTSFGTGFTAVRVLATRESLMPLDPMVDSAPDRYAFVRDSYLQQRGFMIRDGKQASVQENPLKGFDFSD
jgi:phospholipid-binding lipoprotein MlaA